MAYLMHIYGVFAVTVWYYARCGCTRDSTLYASRQCAGCRKGSYDGIRKIIV